MKISEASKIAGVSKRTLQYYDDEGLLSVKRMENNHRDYDLESLQIMICFFVHIILQPL